ncbi:MAG TPA: hypothetical protein VG873_11435 [Burkholderiales bacterium]|nr:hypothetical protein [Burkholderiales bacterium]
MPRVFLAALWTLLAGCVPTIETIFKPEVPGGRLIGASCRGGDGPREVGVFDHGGISIQVLVRGKHTPRDHTGKLLDEVHGVVYVDFLVPEGVTVFLKSGTFELVSAGDRFRVSVVQLSTYPAPGEKRFNISIDGKMVGWTRVRGVRKLHAQYSARFLAPAALAPQFILRLPRATVNGTEVEFPEIRFSETTEPAFHFLNC